MTRSRWRPDAFVLGLLFVLPLVLFWQVTVGPKTLLPADNLFGFAPWRAYADQFGVGVPHNTLVSDLILENYVWKRFIVESIQARELPLWNPYLFAGVPFLAAGQHSALYPFSVIYYVLPLYKAYGWFTVAQLWLAGACMVLLARTLGTGRTGATLAAVTYQLSAFFVVGAVFPMMIAGAAWLPLQLAMIERTIARAPALGGRAARLPWVAIGALGLGMVALAGHVEVLYYTLLVMAFYAAWRLAACVATKERTLKDATVAAGWLLAMVALGMALGAVQIIPLVELGRVNFRQGAATFAQVRGWAYPPRHALAFLMPNVFGNPSYHATFDLFRHEWVGASVNALGEPITTIDWGVKNYVEGAAYVGLLPLLLAVVGLTQRARSRWFFVALAGISLTFAFGTPTYALLYYGLPFASQLHTPFRWVWPFGLAVAALAGFGADAFAHPVPPRPQPSRFAQDRPSPFKGEGARSAGGGGPGAEEARRTSPVLARWLGWGALAGGAAALAGVGLAWALFPRIESLFERALNTLALANRAFPDGRAFFSFEAAQVAIFGLTLALAGVMLLVWRAGRTVTVRGRALSLGGTLAVALVAADLMVASRGFHAAADPAILDFRPPVVEFLAEDEGLWRFTTYNEPGANTLNANSGWMFGFSDVRGYDSIIPKQYADYMALIAPQTQLPYNRIAPIFSDTPHALESPLLDLLGVKYVVSETDVETPGFERVYEDETGIAVYENTRAMPRAFTLPLTSSKPVTNFGEAAQDSDVRRYVLVDDEQAPIPRQGDVQPSDPSAAAITVYTQNEVWIDAQVDEESWLVLADSYFPGWRAWRRPIGGSDDEEVEIDLWRVDGNFRGVMLPEGRHTVRMKYSPDSVKFGAFTTFMGLALLVFALGVWLWRYAYRESDDASAVRRVAKNSLAPIMLNLFNRGIDFAFAFLMLRILRPEGAGNYYYAIVIWGWFEILTNFGLNTFLTREVARAPDDARRFLFNTSLLRMGLAVLAIPALVGFLWLRQVSFDPPLTTETLWTIGLLYLGLFPSSLSTGLSALFYAFEKAEYPAAITTVTTFLKAGVGIVVLLAGAGIVGLAGTSIFVNVVTLVILWALARRGLPPLQAETALRLDRALQRHMLGESLPLMINHLLATFFFKIDVVLLEVIRGPATVGRYSTAYKWLDALNIIPSFFTLAMFPVMSRQAAEDRPALLRAYVLAIKLMVVLALPVAVATTLIARGLIGVLGGPEYLPDGAVALQLIIWSIPIGWINSVTQYVLIALDRQRILTRAFLVGLVFNVGTNLIFMPTYGFRAAAIITIFSELSLLIAFYLTLRNALADAAPDGQREPVAWVRILWRPALASALMGGAVVAALPVGRLPALVVGGVVYVGASLLIRPFTREEIAQIEPLLPARVRGSMMRVLRLRRDAT